jgi:hypothetical protein
MLIIEEALSWAASAIAVSSRAALTIEDIADGLLDDKGVMFPFFI